MTYENHSTSFPAILTFCFGLTCAWQYRNYVAYRQVKLQIERENKLKSELLMRQHEIDSLLNTFLPPKTAEGNPGLSECADRETSHVRDELPRISNQSSRARSQVIEALIGILEKAPEYHCVFYAEPWSTAVYTLGNLKATEAIDVLVRNLDVTGTFLATAGTHPVEDALFKIGEPAVPRLIEALSDERPWVRLDATSTLASIGQPAFVKLQEAMHNGSAETKGGAALALAWFGGTKARIAIEQAVKEESDQEALKKFKDVEKAIKSWGY